MNPELKSSLFRVLPFAFALLTVFIVTKKKKISPQELSLHKPDSTLHFLICTMGFLIFILVTEFSLFEMGILETDKWDHTFIPSVIRIFGAVILAPITEELIFRGLILNALNKKNSNMHLAIFIQACFFVFLHNFTYQNTLTSNIGVAQSLVDASLFGYARYYTKSLYTSMTMHATGNLIATLERFVL